MTGFQYAYTAMHLFAARKHYHNNAAFQFPLRLPFEWIVCHVKPSSNAKEDSTLVNNDARYFAV